MENDGEKVLKIGLGAPDASASRSRLVGCFFLDVAQQKILIIFVSEFFRSG